MAEPPYGEIGRLLLAGRVVPFLGAGVNFGNRPAGAKYDHNSTFLPSGYELSEGLAKDTGFPDTDISDLAKVASYFVDASARQNLLERLHAIFARKYDPCPIHRYLAEIAAQKPLLMVTTNYDDLMEQALDKNHQQYDLVVHPTDRKDLEASVLWRRHGTDQFVDIAPNDLHIDLDERSVVYKMHGTVHPTTQALDSYVITEEDYVDFLSRMTSQTAVPALFTRRFRTSHFLFLGYGLRDWNLRLVLRNLRATPPSGRPLTADGTAAPLPVDAPSSPVLRSWAIQRSPSELESQLWNARSVRLYDKDINDFVTSLRAVQRPPA